MEDLNDKNSQNGLFHIANTIAKAKIILFIFYFLSGIFLILYNYFDEYLNIYDVIIFATWLIFSSTIYLYTIFICKKFLKIKNLDIMRREMKITIFFSIYIFFILLLCYIFYENDKFFYLGPVSFAGDFYRYILSSLILQLIYIVISLIFSGYLFIFKKNNYENKKNKLSLNKDIIYKEKNELYSDIECNKNCNNTKTKYLSILLKSIFFVLIIIAFAGVWFFNYNEGYPFAFTYSGSSVYILLLAYIGNYLVFSAAISAVFFAFRLHLFGRGRPILAGFTLLCLIAMFGYAAQKDLFGENKIMASPVFAIGNTALFSRIQSLTDQAASNEELATVATNQTSFAELCFDYGLEGSVGGIEVKREGLYVLVPIEDEVFEEFIKGNPCDATVLEKANKEKEARKPKSQKILESYFKAENPELKEAFIDAFKSTLFLHPDAIAAFTSFIRGEITTDEFEKIKVQIFSKGQIKDPQWEMIVSNEEKGLEMFVDKRIWRNDEKHSTDTWYVWKKYVSTKPDNVTNSKAGRYFLNLTEYNCSDTLSYSNGLYMMFEESTSDVPVTVLYEGFTEKATSELNSGNNLVARFVCSDKVTNISIK